MPFVKKQLQRKEGYLEYEWKNLAETIKALYMTWFEPWDWIISASSYREEFSTLVNIKDFRDRILAVRFGHRGESPRSRREYPLPSRLTRPGDSRTNRMAEATRLSWW